MTVKTSDIRQSFLDYFVRHDHKLVPSSPVIPFDDPTILFTNAGMNQFKDVFTGKRKTDFPRATSSQKCIRAGGKHNDLDNVGFTARHHTFFEMLGNFSFGDYFKEEAIHYAWEWVTKELKLPKDRLYATVYETDDEAFRLWEKIAPELKGGRVMRFGKKDNYWSMGDVGPCGPCSEIHFDRGERFGSGKDDVVNGEGERFVEIWNLVFMQYDQLPGGGVTPLPRPSVDTGAGLERITCVMNDADTNYRIDIFQALIKAITDLAHSKYTDNVASHHVIADHVRALTFAIADGSGISNEGRGYVLRRILRRAARHARLLGAHEPIIYKLVPTLVDQMAAAFPEIKAKQSHVMRVIQTEEEAFGRTLETGLELFEKVAKKVKSSGSKVVDGETVFKLYDTYGFPADLTEILAHEQGLTIDQAGFDEAMCCQQERSRSASDFDSKEAEHLRSFIETLERTVTTGTVPNTAFVRTLDPLQSTVTSAGKTTEDGVAVVLDKTPFYFESGGQIGDIGKIRNDKVLLSVKSVVEHQGRYIHAGILKRGSLTDLLDAKVHVEIDLPRRWDIMRNHTATHLLHKALRTVLGEHVHQSGSYVGPDRLRFDFSHHQPMTPEEITRVEAIVNEQILKGTEVVTDIMDIESAKKTGAMALFGEKYGDKVRVVSVPGFSKELCGGTHVQNTSQIGPFFVTLETGIASGVRRIEAVTGTKAQELMREFKQFRRDAAHVVGRPEPEALAAIRQLKDEHLSFQKELKRVKAEMFSGGTKSVGEEISIGPLRLVTHDFGETDKDVMAGWIDSQKVRPEPLVVAALGLTNGKVSFVAAASQAAISDLKIDVGEISKLLLPQFGGRGGGKAAFAQGGVANGSESSSVFAKMKEIIQSKV